MSIYFGFAISDSMFPAYYEGNIKRSVLSPEDAKLLINDDATIICLNPSHTATIEAMYAKFGIHCEVPEKAPIINLSVGDSLIVMAVTGLPRLMDRHEYTRDEINGAKFRFAMYTLT